MTVVASPESFPEVDVVGLGENATDTVIRLPHFPAFNTSTPILSAEILPGGQVATALVACQFWGLRTRYFGKVGSDAAGRFQQDEFRRAGVEAHLRIVPECPSQNAYILVDQSSGERTILFQRDLRLSHQPGELQRPGIVNARVLHVDGHDTAANATAAGWARDAGIPVTGDIDNLYPGYEKLVSVIDYLIGSQDLPQRLTGSANLPDSLAQVAERFGCRFVAATLGREGVLGFDRGTRRYSYCPAYRVEARDTTGAGDVFHGAFVLGLVRGWPMHRILDFSCAAAALNCTSLGARGGIKPLAEIEKLTREGPKHSAVAAFASFVSQGSLE